MNTNRGLLTDTYRPHESFSPEAWLTQYVAFGQWSFDAIAHPLDDARLAPGHRQTVLCEMALSGDLSGIAWSGMSREDHSRLAADLSGMYCALPDAEHHLLIHEISNLALAKIFAMLHQRYGLTSFP